ncbi:MAG: hypothetical protein AB8B62_07180 [Roseobacter sp.]
MASFEEGEARIETLERQNEMLLEQLNWLRQRCRRENIEIAEVSRPLKFSAKCLWIEFCLSD